MEKISSILPSNARIKSVDMKSSHAARPGAPAFGRMQGSTASEDRVSFGDVESIRENLGTGYNPKEARHAKIAEDMAKNFFDNRLRETPKEEVEMIAVIVEPVTAQPSENPETGGSYQPLNLYA